MLRFFASLILLAGFVLGQHVDGSLERISVATDGSAQLALAGVIDGRHDESGNGTDGLDAQHKCPHGTCSQSFLKGTVTVANLLDYSTLKKVRFNNQFLHAIVFERDPPIPKPLI